MNFNHINAAAAAAAGNSGTGLNMNSFTAAVQNLLANSNIDLSQFANLGNLGSFAAAAAAPQNVPSSRHSLPQAHHRSANSASNSTGAQNTSISSNSSASHLATSLSNLANATGDGVAGLSLAGLPASLTNLTSTALADFAAAATGAAAHQSTAPSSRSSLQSAHHRSSSSTSSNHHAQQNHHHSPATQLPAAHQPNRDAAKVLAAAAAAASHQSQNSTLNHRHSSHNSSFNHLNSNTLSKNALNSLNLNLNNASLNSVLQASSSVLGNNTSAAALAAANAAAAAAAAVVAAPVPSATQQLIVAASNTSSITPPKNSTCYRVGECVKFEPAPTMPLQIGKIDEICKNNGDNIEVKVVLFFDRNDIPTSLMTLADKYQYDESQEEEINQMSEEDKSALKKHELFYSRQIETIPASAIRGKCTVQLLNESESLASYLGKDNHYFYTLVYDPQQKTITADRGEIRVGQRYQAEIQPSAIYEPQLGGDPSDPRDLTKMETMVYTPDHELTDDDINKFLTIAKSVGTFARALDCSSSIKQPSLHLTAASASRDVTLLYAMQLLHQNNYDLGKACLALVPSTGPVLCRDEIEEWTAGEATLFEEAIEKYGREFNEIRQDFLPWKSVKNIVEYYYMWKTTDRSINQRRMKALEAENKVSVLYIRDPENEFKRTSENSASASSTNTNNNETSNKKSNAIKRELADDSTPAPPSENQIATLKRRQVAEQLPKHTTPGEHLRFIATPRYKKMRAEMISRKQWRHLSRRPWERRAKTKP